MDLVAAAATPGAWVDSDWPLGSHAVSALVSIGKVGVVRYVPLPGNTSVGDITRTELETIVAAGLELLLVQHVRTPPWNPALANGDRDAAAVLDHCAAIGYPHDAHVYLDLEGISGGAGATTGYAIDWQHTIRSGLQAAGLYIGFAVPLHPADLYNLPGFNTYWSDMADRQVAVRGTAMIQGPAVTIAGVEYDIDTCRKDKKGELPIACKMAPPTRPELPRRASGLPPIS
jgi:hypothetical protein